MSWSSVSFVSEAEDANSGSRRTMEDIHIVKDNFAGLQGQGFFCVCDGHGGKDIVDFLEEHLASTLERNLSALPNPSQLTGGGGCFGKNKKVKTWKTDVMEVIIATLAEVDNNSSHIRTSGSTVACCLVRPGIEEGARHLFMANLGDTRVVLSNSDGSVERLSYDHTAEDAQEIKRIEEAGGFILRKRILGILSVARAIGDHTMKKYVISVPHTRELLLTPEHEFVIIACDGVWDVLEDSEAVAFIKDGLSNKTFTRDDAAARLVREAIEKGSQDNITVLVVFL